VPSQAAGGGNLGLLVALHGGGGTAAGVMDFYRPDANQRGYFVLAVEARGGTWDAINGRFSLDPPFIDQALAFAFAHCRVDSGRIYLAGASDGATYGLGLGLANGDMFRRLLMFFPGAIATSDSPRLGKPEIFIAHGTADTIFPVERSRLVTVPALRGEGYTVEYLEFDGGHSIPAAVAQQALDWLARP
jgi:predicted esterase